MFKKVDYIGFDGKPELRSRAEELTQTLVRSIRTWRDEVVVEWEPASRAGDLSLTLALTMPNGLIGDHTGTISKKQLADDDLSAIHCGQVWSDLLGSLILQIDERVQESLLEPMGA